MSESKAEFLSYEEINDEESRARYGAGPGDKLIVCRLRINGEKWVDIQVVSAGLIASGDDWLNWIKSVAMQNCEYLYQGGKQ